MRHRRSRRGPQTVIRPALTVPLLSALPLPPGARRLHRVWRRSLTTRVVVTTLVSSAVVVGLLASLLIGQVGRGLVDAKTKVSLSEAQTGLDLVQEAPTEDTSTADGRTTADPAGQVDQVQQALQAATSRLISRGQVGEQYIALVPTSDDLTKVISGGLSVSDLPARLVRALDDGRSVAYVYASVRLSGRSVDALVVGGVLTTSIGPYQLYSVFPLTGEQQTYALVRRTAGIAGLLLVLLLAAIAGLVVRQVVRPVRLAAQTAGRLAAGQLEERMAVRGEDELARLGTSFNAMSEALQRQIRQLEDLSRVQQRFVSDVTHELRTPLTTVRMAADVLHEARADFPPATARAAELLQAQLGRFEELLAELLEISRYDAGVATLEQDANDLVPVVQRVFALTQSLADSKGSALVLRAAGPVVAEFDAVRVERVVRNLVVNAVEHGEGRPVEVTVACSADVAAVVVRDHGVGLRPGEAGLVFTRFWRADPSRARTTGGTGLGLAIALEDARLHGGSLQAWGAPGEGATFRLLLPVRAGEPLGRSPLPLRPDDLVGAGS